MANYNSVRAGRAYIELFLDRSRFDSGMKKATSSIRSFTDKAASLGAKLSLPSMGLSLGIAKAVKDFSAFDDKIRFTGVLSEATGQQLEVLNQEALRLGRTTSFTAQEVGEGMVSMGRMGLKYAGIMRTTEHMLDLARATDTSVSFASESALNTINAFNLKMSDAANVSDVLAATANGSAQTLVDLAESLSKVSAQAGAAHDDFRSVSASLGVLANLGIKGEIAGTALRNAYLRMSHADIRDLLKSVGVESLNAEGNLRPMVYILRDLSEVMDRLTTPDKLYLAEKIFDIRGSLAGLQLSTHPGKVRDFLKRVGFAEDEEEMKKYLKKNKDIFGSDSNFTVKGYARKVAKERDAGMGGTLRIILSAAEGLKLAIGNIVSSLYKIKLDHLIDDVNILTEKINAHPDVIRKIMNGILAVTGAGIGLIAVSKTLQMIWGGISIAIGTASFLANAKVIMVTAAIAGVADVVFRVSKNVGVASRSFVSFGSTARLAMQSVTEAFKSGNFLKAFQIAIEGATAMFKSFVNSLAQMWSNFTNYFSDMKNIKEVEKIDQERGAFLKWYESVRKGNGILMGNERPLSETEISRMRMEANRGRGDSFAGEAAEREYREKHPFLELERELFASGKEKGYAGFLQRRKYLDEMFKRENERFQKRIDTARGKDKYDERNRKFEEKGNQIFTDFFKKINEIRAQVPVGNEKQKFTGDAGELKKEDDKTQKALESIDFNTGKTARNTAPKHTVDFNARAITERWSPVSAFLSNFFAKSNGIGSILTQEQIAGVKARTANALVAKSTSLEQGTDMNKSAVAISRIEQIDKTLREMLAKVTDLSQNTNRYAENIDNMLRVM